MRKNQFLLCVLEDLNVQLGPPRPVSSGITVSKLLNEVSDLF